jgi:hypothetical protein
MIIKTVLDLLPLDDYYGISRNIDIAKGLYKKPSNWSEMKSLVKRAYYGR